jgi:hypothetical protein
MDPKGDFESELAKRLARLKPAIARNPGRAQAGRAEFLQAAGAARPALETTEGVSFLAKWRHTIRMHPLLLFFQIYQKEHSLMYRMFVTIVILSVLVIGGAASVATAQSSRPDQPIYALKVLSEDVRLNLTSDPAAESRLALEYASRRAQEISQVLQSGGIPPAEVQTRYQDQVEQALAQAVDLPDSQLAIALVQAQSDLKAQQVVLEQVQTNGSPEAERVLEQSKQMLAERLGWVDEGLKYPERLRERMHRRRPHFPTGGTVTPTATLEEGTPRASDTPDPGYPPPDGDGTTTPTRAAWPTPNGTPRPTHEAWPTPNGTPRSTHEAWPTPNGTPRSTHEAWPTPNGTPESTREPRPTPNSTHEARPTPQGPLPTPDEPQPTPDGPRPRPPQPPPGEHSEWEGQNLLAL